MAAARFVSVFSPRQSVWWSHARSISTTYKLYSGEERLEKAKQKLSQLTEDPGNTANLQLYALYKQV